MPMSHSSLHVDADPARAWTLPARCYSDPGIFAAELNNIFSSTWQVIGHKSRWLIPETISQGGFIGEPLLIVCGAEGHLRGFFNVCRHRAGPAAEGCGSRKVFRCGYHGWTYGLDGAHQCHGNGRSRRFPP